eukprot:Plantae.Rhodophyta-Hildenbrandia_rubra.ctg2781.p1 GENE.Plantae.Rhodophyta-Hildenbrandia_rubra.ctg2781~~Plantae.Rhodophyta-Hildenbrandia_rubra.ctg2781.p1  ORF type:complete len:770 (-),score=108.19 Plantae.Rhodophyta-Hildenbrandia_rubra.ctg2781:3122-5431(-)
MPISFGGVSVEEWNAILAEPEQACTAVTDRNVPAESPSLPDVVDTGNRLQSYTWDKRVKSWSSTVQSPRNIQVKEWRSKYPVRQINGRNRREISPVKVVRKSFTSKVCVLSKSDDKVTFGRHATEQTALEQIRLPVKPLQANTVDTLGPSSNAIPVKASISLPKIPVPESIPTNTTLISPTTITAEAAVSPNVEKGPTPKIQTQESGPSSVIKPRSLTPSPKTTKPKAGKYEKQKDNDTGFVVKSRTPSPDNRRKRRSGSPKKQAVLSKTQETQQFFETAKVNSNPWQQPRRRSAVSRQSRATNGHRPSSPQEKCTVKQNGVRKPIPGEGVDTSSDGTGNSYSADFPDALTNGYASKSKKLSAGDFDYENNMEKLLEALENEGIASGLPIMPVGLVNPSSTCYMNVIVQALFSCSPLTRVLASKDLTYQSKVLEKLHLFYLRIAMHEQNEKGRMWPSPLVPSIFYNIFPSTNGDSTNNNRAFSQEDAQEFFAHILNIIDEEILKSLPKDKQKAPLINGTRSLLDWSVVGVGGKKVRDRDFDDGNQRKTVASELFGGLTLSEIVHTGKGRNTGGHNRRFERFYSLGLEVGNGTSSIEDGLQKYFREERLDSGMVKNLDIVTWPKVLVIQLMRFGYRKETNEVEKIPQRCSYPEFLDVEDSPRISTRGRGRRREQHRYRLVSVITHHGKDIASGHYTCDVWRDGKVDVPTVENDRYYRPNGRARKAARASNQSPWFREQSGWYNCDDSKMSEVSKEEVLNRQAYLLFYTMM